MLDAFWKIFSLVIYFCVTEFFFFFLFLQAKDYVSKSQKGQSMDGFAEVISRVRFSSDEGAKYSGDLLAIMEILKNTTELYKGNGLKLSNADVEVK